MIFQVTCNQLIGWPEIFKGPKGPSSLDNIIWFNDSFNEFSVPHLFQITFQVMYKFQANWKFMYHIFIIKWVRFHCFFY